LGFLVELKNEIDVINCLGQAIKINLLSPNEISEYMSHQAMNTFPENWLKVEKYL
jgi:hypothetical protein